jgi:hypothetical protein
LNYNAHAKFIQKWLDRVEAEDKEAKPVAAPAAEAPAVAA